MASLHIFGGSRWATRPVIAITNPAHARPRWPTPTARVVWALSWAVAFAGAFAASCWFFVRTPAGQDFDTDAFWRLVPRAWGLGAWLASIPVIMPLIILGAGVCAVAGATILLIRAVGFNRAVMRGVGVTLMVMVTYLVALILRDVVLAAPPATIGAGANTFPTIEVALAVALGWATLLMVPGRKLPWVIAFAVIVVSQSVVTIALDGSQPSNALGGLLLGASMGALTTALFLPTADIPSDGVVATCLAPPLGGADGTHSGHGGHDDESTWAPQDPANSYLFETSGTTPETDLPVLSTPGPSWDVDIWSEIGRRTRD